MRRSFLAAMLAGIFFLFLLQIHEPNAAEPPQEPILRLETGMHTSKITRIGMDADERWLTAASEDKTVRLWELPSGRLARVFRPPIGIGNEGKLYAVAVSHDGQQIVCGGWTQFAGGSSSTASDGHAIYLFDRSTGLLAKRITGLPNVINHLIYSPNGRHLVACLWNGGIRIYNAENLRLAGEDKYYGEASYGADFALDGRLVTSSFDGYLRLYNRDFCLIAKKAGGSNPFHIRFSPDGQKIAVGFSDSTRVDILSARDLTHIFSPDTSGIDNGNLFSVAWDGAGPILYAGGRHHDGKECPIFAWTEAGRGKRSSLPGATNTIMDIRTMKNGGFVYGAYDPPGGPTTMPADENSF